MTGEFDVVVRRIRYNNQGVKLKRVDRHGAPDG
jgi:hypothetical protein